ncbi:MAG: ferrous iron transporter B [Clostridia bacterium]|nr:ferrous iron transporter B [Clostridia bacterium]
MDANEAKRGDMITVALAGNPNVGKSTLFNALTGLRQHTGNWTGKTVGCAEGICRRGEMPMRMVDLPGTYSLDATSEEERLAGDYIRSGEADVIAVVADGGCLSRNLILLLQILPLCERVVLCVNLLDEAEKKGVFVDCEKLSGLLGIPVVGMSARSERGIDEAVGVFETLPRRKESILIEGIPLAKQAEEIASAVVSGGGEISRSDRKWDRILLGKYTAFPLMLLMLSGILWLTAVGANVPSEALFWLFSRMEMGLRSILCWLGSPLWLSGILLDGIWRTVTWVVAVMLPPMAIFFPLFTLLEDLGVLPRVAFNLDRCFRSCDACGKQALTM